ncbi:MAG: CBS domain-containing protein [Nitrospirae bacterium]|nr:CBS domain-containing protein [Nitrospirota bacterium]
MKVKEIMTSPVQYCGPDTNLAAAAMMMWDSDCGILPVVNHEGKVIGMITDRDICMAAATKHRIASDITVWETISGKVHTCSPDDDMRTVLKTMAVQKVRRLPVVDEDGTLRGILAINDIVLEAEEAKGKKMPDIPYEDVINTLKAISAHRVLAAA